jgi:uncharacterized membrane protein
MTRNIVRIIRFVLVAALLATWLYWLHQWQQFPRDSTMVMGALLGFEALALAAWICPIELRRLRIATRVLGTLVGVMAAALSVLLAEFVMDGV